MNTKLVRFTKWVLDFMFYSGILITTTLYFILKGYAQWEPRLLDHLWQTNIALSICGVFAVLILWELRKIFKTVLHNDCFVTSNVTSLRRMGSYSFAIAITMIVELIIYPSLASITIVLVFLIAAMFSKVLAQVFAKAIDYKQETDYTI